ncbi:hypothetical protein [Lysinibacillus sp. fls2-241-R2A-57]|uniref:hypothetical protein n=2 Tax=unclassified Lysinibacillus TaxID=2636778 RepID=UPI00255370DD|nr:hypothetical protein [Lysinibacillus sp. fls2-241-R2A-57]
MPAIGSHVIYPTVKMTGSVQAKPFVYDKAAVEKAKLKQEIVLAATTILGSLKIVGTIFTVYFGATAITSTTVDFPMPKVGDKVDVTFIAQSLGGARVETRFTQIPYTDSNGNSKSGQVVTKNSYIAFVPYSR